jgi:hypothetical protein
LRPGVFEVGQRDARQPFAQGALDRANLSIFLRRCKRERIAGFFCPAGTPHSMNVIVG